MGEKTPLGLAMVNGEVQHIPTLELFLLKVMVLVQKGGNKPTIPFDESLEKSSFLRMPSAFLLLPNCTSDICVPGFGSICNTFAYNSLKFKSIPSGFNVTGAWSEKWR
ncbi:MAG: hypothetical protein ACHBN1_19420 [Heteroscytonema crispum UTEX LB 1556]